MVTQMDDDVWWVECRGVNAYLVDDDGAVTLVDAGMPRDGRRIRRELGAAGFAPDDLDRILVTHYDPDHVGGLSAFDDVDVPVHAGAADAPLVSGDRRPSWTDRKGLFHRLAGPFLAPPANPVIPLADGDTVGSFTVYETPGHTRGHVAYVSEDLSVAMLGDAVSESDGRLKLAPRFLTHDVAAAGRSVRDLSERAPEFDVAGMGHGVPFVRGGKERLDDLAASL